MQSDFKCTVVKQLKEYDILFGSLTEEDNNYNYKLEESFFKTLESDDITDSDVDVKVEVVIHSRFFEFLFEFEGEVEVACDRCLDSMRVEVFGDNKLIVKYGEEFSEEDEALVVIPENQNFFNVAQYIYEYIHLALPIQRSHETEEECNKEMINRLHSHQIEEEKSEEIDPRWEQLKKLNNIK